MRVEFSIGKGQSRVGLMNRSNLEKPDAIPRRPFQGGKHER